MSALQSRTLRDLDTGLDSVVIHHPEEQLSSSLVWDYSWTARCPNCKQDATWQRKPTEPVAHIHCPCPIPTQEVA